MGLSCSGGLYAYAVRTLVAGVNDVETRLLYPKGDDGGLYVLSDPSDVLERLAGFVSEARRHVLAGNLLPGAGAKRTSTILPLLCRVGLRKPTSS